MLVKEYGSQNYRLHTCTESDYFKLESINPRKYIGYLQMNANDGRLEIRDLWINEEPEDFRGKGFGSILIQHAFEYAKERDINFIFGRTQIDDCRAHNFYKKCGFKIFISEKRDIAFFTRSLNGELNQKLNLEHLDKVFGWSNELSF